MDRDDIIIKISVSVLTWQIIFLQRPLYSSLSSLVYKNVFKITSTRLAYALLQLRTMKLPKSKANLIKNFYFRLNAYITE